MLAHGTAVDLDDLESLDWDDEGFPRLRASKAAGTFSWLLLLFGAANLFSASEGTDAPAAGEPPGDSSDDGSIFAHSDDESDCSKESAVS